MNRFSRFSAAAALLVSLAGCGLFEDQIPEDIFFRMSGPTGSQVTVIYSKQFVAGVNEIGQTRLEVFGADTVVHTLPIDTVIDVRLEQRLFLRASPLAASDTLAVDARVDVDGRNIYSDQGDLFPLVPWQFFYQYNVTFTQDVEVII
jgi:hypothetical protein